MRSLPLDPPPVASQPAVPPSHGRKALFDRKKARLSLRCCCLTMATPQEHHPRDKQPIAGASLEPPCTRCTPPTPLPAALPIGSTLNRCSCGQPRTSQTQSMQQTWTILKHDGPNHLWPTRPAAHLVNLKERIRQSPVRTVDYETPEELGCARSHQSQLPVSEKSKITSFGQLEVAPRSHALWRHSALRCSRADVLLRPSPLSQCPRFLLRFPVEEARRASQ